VGRAARARSGSGEAKRPPRERRAR
jgi:hypothetical protein